MHPMQRHSLPSVSVAGIDKTQGRLTWPDGTFSDTVGLTFDPSALTLQDIMQTGRRVKLNAVAHLRYVKAIHLGRASPLILAWDCLSRDRAASSLFPGIWPETDSGEVLLSANSLITYTLRQLLARNWLQRRAGSWHAAMPACEPRRQARGQAVVSFLNRTGRLQAYGGPGRPIPDDCPFPDFPVLEDLIPVGKLGFLRELVWHRAPLAAFNTGYFLLEHADFLSHHSALGEPYNLFVTGDIIQRPPLYRRCALFQHTDGLWSLDHFSLSDVVLSLPDGSRLVPAGSRAAGLPFVVNEPGDIALYTRYYGISQAGRVLGRTPVESGRFEITVIDRRPVSWKVGGGLELPQNGLVISFSARSLGRDAKRELEDALGALAPASYEFVASHGRSIRQAIQVGPQLLHAGQITLDDNSLRREEFWVNRRNAAGELEIGVVPTDYPNDVDRSRAGRCGVGIKRDGRLVLVAVPSTETGVTAVRRPEADSQGATLVELAALLLEAGAMEAVNLDGGGSTQVFFLGGVATTPGNRLGLPGVTYERMVPSVGVVS